MSSLKEKLYEHLLGEVYCKLGVSQLHGIGVFALRDIPKGTKPLNSMVSKKEIKFSRVELKKVPSSVRKHLASFCLVDKGRVFAPEIGMNAVSDIERNEELTIDYDISFGEEHLFGEDDPNFRSSGPARNT